MGLRLATEEQGSRYALRLPSRWGFTAICRAVRVRLWIANAVFVIVGLAVLGTIFVAELLGWLGVLR